MTFLSRSLGRRAGARAWLAVLAIVVASPALGAPFLFDFVAPTKFLDDDANRCGALRVEFQEVELSQVGDTLKRMHDAAPRQSLWVKQPVVHVVVSPSRSADDVAKVLAEARAEFRRGMPDAEPEFRLTSMYQPADVVVRLAREMEAKADEIAARVPPDDHEAGLAVESMRRAASRAREDAVHFLKSMQRPENARRITQGVATARALFLGGMRTFQVLGSGAVGTVGAAAAAGLGWGDGPVSVGPGAAVAAAAATMALVLGDGVVEYYSTRYQLAKDRFLREHGLRPDRALRGLAKYLAGRESAPLRWSGRAMEGLASAVEPFFRGLEPIDRVYRNNRLVRRLKHSFYNFLAYGVLRRLTMQLLGHVAAPSTIPAPGAKDVAFVGGNAVVGTVAYSLFSSGIEELRDKGWMSRTAEELVARMFGLLDVVNDVILSVPGLRPLLVYTQYPQWAGYALIGLLGYAAPVRIHRYVLVDRDLYGIPGARRDVDEAHHTDGARVIANDERGFYTFFELVSTLRSAHSVGRCAQLLFGWGKK